MSSEYEGRCGNVGAEFKKLGEDLERFASESGAVIIRSVERSVECAADEINRRVTKIFDGARDTGKRAAEYVERNPWQVALFVLVAGLAVGWAGASGTRKTNEEPD